MCEDDFGVENYEIVLKRWGDHIKIMCHIHGAKDQDDMGPCS